MFLGLTTLQFAKRVIMAVFWAVLTFALAFYLPTFAFGLVGLPLEETQPIILPGAIALTALGVMREVFRNHPLGIASGVGLVLGSAFYLLRITNNGFLTIQAMGLKITLEFPILVNLFVTSSMLTLISVIWSAIHSAYAEPMMEEEITP